MTCDTPSDEVDRSSSMPLIVLTASSILSVTSVSICSGAAPGCTVVTSDGREVDLRESIDAQLKERKRADDGQRQDQDRREDRTTHAERSKPLHENLALRAGVYFTFIPSTSCADVRGRDAFAGLEPVDDLHERIEVCPVVTTRSSTRSPLTT